MAVSEKTINEVFAAAWEIAVHRNPVLLARLQTDSTIERTRQRIGEMMAQGCSFAVARDHIVNELLEPNSPLYQEPH